MLINLNEIKIGKPVKFKNLKSPRSRPESEELKNEITVSIKSLEIGQCITIKSERYNQLRRAILWCARALNKEDEDYNLKIVTRTSFNPLTNRNDGIIVYRIK